ncbi:hypothetical protein PVK06_046505 [Gossypium arboreum]|uniref:Aminotransferase-like plant mobile domain-containing protein n=1 Tax=Gossypium arboreum TaxID=29729 RepID=A0ABR0MB71_GOSAR|nr:hypothetical protein PVK06_046505 [Gossypium arboreum]
MKMSAITVDRKLLEGSGFLTCGHYRPGVQVEPETHQRINRERSDRDGLGTRHIPGVKDDSTELERIRYARAYILEMIGGSLMQDLSQNLIHLRWNHLASYVGIPAALEDIRLLLDQRSEAQFQWIPYEDPAIQAVILEEFFQNLNIWHVKVPLVNYSIVEMHQMDRVLQQFGFSQPIPKEPKVLDEQHKIDLRLTNTNWLLFWLEYIEILENIYNHIPNREPIIILELACTLDYMPWFRIHGKPYLLSEDQTRWQICVERERRGPLNPKRRDDGTGPSIAPIQSPGLSTTSTQSLGRMP